MFIKFVLPYVLYYGNYITGQLLAVEANGVCQAQEFLLNLGLAMWP